MRSRLSLASLGALAVAVALACACAPRPKDEGEGTRGPQEPAPSEVATASPEEPAEETPAKRSPIRVYFLRDAYTEGTGAQERVAPVRRFAESAGVGAAAVKALLEGPTAEERDVGFSSAVPPGVRLLGLTIRDGVAVVDLSAGFQAGGGSASMRGRVAQLVYTLTQFPSVDSVELRLEGRRVTELGGEGLLLERPQTRADWEDLTPIVLVEEPAYGDVLDSPLEVSGTANTFEAEFSLDVLPASAASPADRLVTRQVMATSGSGTRGTFSTELRFDADPEEALRVVAWYASAKDGRRVEVFDVPSPEKGE